MPINRLDSNKPSSSYVDGTRTDGSSRIAIGANFQGRKVSIAGQQQSTSFLPTGDTRQLSHTLPSTSHSVSLREVAASPTYENQPSDPVYENQPLDPMYENQPSDPMYENQPSDPMYENQPSGLNDYEEMNSPLSDYVRMNPAADDYVRMNPAADDYVRMNPAADDYVRMNPAVDDYVRMNPAADDYVRMGSPSENTYAEARAVIGKTTREQSNQTEITRAVQLASECSSYIKELEGDFEKATRCAKNLGTTSKNDMIALKNFIIPQHIDCIGTYTRAIQNLLKLQNQTPEQQRYLRDASAKLAAMRTKLHAAQSIIGEAIQTKIFSTDAASDSSSLTVEEKSTAGQLTKTRADISAIYENAVRIRSEVNKLVNRLPASGRRTAEELRAIFNYQRQLVNLKIELPECVDKISESISTMDHNEQLIREHPNSAEAQLTFRERRYPMRLARYLDAQTKNVSNIISESWENLSRLTQEYR